MRLGCIFVTVFLLMLLRPFVWIQRLIISQHRFSRPSGWPLYRYCLASYSAPSTASSQPWNLLLEAISRIGARQLLEELTRHPEFPFVADNLWQSVCAATAGLGQIACLLSDEPDFIVRGFSRDLHYLRHHSIVLDLRILLVSFFHVLLSPWWPR